MNDQKEEIKTPLLHQEPQDPSLGPKIDKGSKQSPFLEEEKHPSVSFRKLYRFATPHEKFLFIIACFLSIFVGGAFPLFSLIWGNTANAFSPDNLPNLKSLVGQYALQIGGIGVAVMILFFIILSIMKYVGQRQGTRMRAAYLRAIMRQEMGYFDKIDPAELSSRVEDDCKTILEGTEDKVLMFLYGIFTFIGGFIVAFYRGWQLTLILLALTPFQAVAGFIYGRFVAKAVERNRTAYAKAGAIAEQALSSIRTIVGLAGEDKEVKRYKKELNNTKKTMIKYGLIQGLSIGVFSMVSYFFYACAFYFGSTFIQDHVYDDGSQRDYTGGDVLSVYFAVVTGASSLVVTAPSMKAFASAKQTASKVFALIDRESKINHEETAGIVLDNFEARIEFKDVVFSFPSHPDKLILNHISFELSPGKTTAIVGESGSGKSTIVQLIERLYDPQSGSIELDGHNLKDLNLKRLRESISYVGQEPVLFTGTIRENLELAKEGITENQMIDALKKANAYDFVIKLEKKLDTFVGVGGIQLSGGQKQRIAIARAILRNSKILLLDEATSALDRKNEKAIQETLDHISTGLTTIIIAHRLSTIKNADHIIVLKDGIIEESGTHTELANFKGLYYHLHQGQLNIEDEVQEETEKDNNQEIEDKDDQDEEKKSIQEENGFKELDMNILFMNSKENEKFLTTPESTKKKISPKTSEVFEQKQKNPEEKKKIKNKQALLRLLTFSRPERPLFLASLVVSIFIGMISPLIAILISNVLFVLLDPSKEGFKHEANMYSLGFLIIAFAVFFLYTMQFWFFSILSESLTNRLRQLVFRKYLHMHMGWHDKPENSSGVLSSTLSTDASNVSSLTSTVIGLIFQGISALISGIAIAFASCWQIALASILMVPVILLLAGIQRSISSKIAAQVEATKRSTQIASEAINNIRTIACLGKEDIFREKYEKILKSIEARMIRLGALQGLCMGANQFTIYIYFGVTFYIGALVTADLGLDPRNVFIALFAIINAVFSISGSMRYLPDVAKANNSADLLFKHIDMTSEIDIDNTTEKYKENIRGYIEFRNVSFKFPSRQNQVLKDLSFKVDAGQKVALVGPSGCGKSTAIQLLLRFYDVEKGEILIDGVNIKDFDLRHLRRSFGFVFQEPVLFNGSIEFNIKYSKEEATTEEMNDAAKRANAYDFIQRNEFQVINEVTMDHENAGVGFKRVVGPKGTQLSGGQKQRIALARAIITDPSMLLLDEATSALDSQNEAIVQDSIDKITEGVTTITVAHRFSTIKHCDYILVLKEGEVVERGTYDTLAEKKGFFYQLERGLD